jgi:hypothetical protein
LTETEAPVVGAAVELMNRDETLRMVSDREGRFRFEGLRPGWARVIVEAPGFLRNQPEAFEVAAGEEHLALRLRTRAPLVVSMQGESSVDRPIRVRITKLSMGPVRRESLRKGADGTDVRIERMLLRRAALPEASVEEVVPPAGELWLYGLHARAEYALWSGPSPSGLLAHVAGVMGDAGGVVLEPRPAVEVTGTYRLETGDIPDGATVVASGDGFVVTAIQPEPGKFLVRGVPEAPLYVVARASTPDGARWTGFAKARGGGAPVDVVLGPMR